MTIDNYWLYIFIASATIASLGPGVILTLTNSLRYGAITNLFSVLGIALGMFTIAVLSGTGLGIILATSAKAYVVIKVVGAVYLVYLGLKLLKNRNASLELKGKQQVATKNTLFFQGLGITLLNPKPIIFFMALFPQFIVTEEAYLPQFLVLSLTFCLLIIVIHTVYAVSTCLLSNRSRLNLPMVNTVGGVAYIGFAFALLFSRRS